MSRRSDFARAAATVVLGLLPVIAASAGAAAGAACDAGGKPANLDFTLKDPDGREVSLRSYRGKVIVLDFWATWCAPCRVEVPGFVELQSTYGPRGFTVVGVSVDEAVAPVKRFAREMRMNYPVVMGAGREDLQKAFGPIIGFPTAIVIARDGTICRRHTGLTKKEVFESEIRPLL